MASISDLGKATPPISRAATSGEALAERETPVRAASDDAGRLRTRTLINLRWLAVAGQLATVLITGAGLKAPLPYPQLLSLIATAAFVNIGLMIAPAGQRVAKTWEATCQLAFDIAQLAALLYFTGGVVNPFALLLIAPVTVGAATLPGRDAVALGLVAAAADMFLLINVHAMPWLNGAFLPERAPYAMACAYAVLVGIAFTGSYAYRAASEAAKMQLALHVTDTVMAREQRLSALGALAAAAAHELGTPLSTITVIARELAREAPEGTTRDDLELLLTQAQRCRDILRNLAEAPEIGDAVHERMSLLQFVRELIQPYQAKREVATEALVTGPAGMAAPDIWRRSETLRALNSIVENAFDFARGEVLVTARFDAEWIAVEVRDDGPGFSTDILSRLGEPYVTSRPAAEGSRTGHIGMGLGFFIAKTLLERTGASVRFGNAGRAGAVVTARWRRSRMEALELDA